MFTATLFTIAKTWKHPNVHQQKNECDIYIYTHTHTHTHTMEYYSVIEKNEIMPFAATWMDLEIIILSELSQRKPNIT